MNLGLAFDENQEGGLVDPTAVVAHQCFLFGMKKLDAGSNGGESRFYLQFPVLRRDLPGSSFLENSLRFQGPLRQPALNVLKGRQTADGFPLRVWPDQGEKTSGFFGCGNADIRQRHAALKVTPP